MRDLIGQNIQASIRKQKVSTSRPMTRLSSNYGLAECRRLIDPVFVLFDRVRSERATAARSVTPASAHRAIGCPCSVAAKTVHDAGDSRTGPITALIEPRPDRNNRHAAFSCRRSHQTWWAAWMSYCGRIELQGGSRQHGMDGQKCPMWELVS